MFYRLFIAAEEGCLRQSKRATYNRKNKYIVNINAGITVNGLGSGYIIMAGLPTAGNGTQLIGSGNENAVTGKALTMSSITTSSIAVTFYDATYPGASGANLRVCLVYQA